MAPSAGYRACSLVTTWQNGQPHADLPMLDASICVATSGKVCKNPSVGLSRLGTRERMLRDSEVDIRY